MSDPTTFDFIEKNGKQFRIGNQRLLLTYKTHLNKKSFINDFKTKFKPKEIHICHENGDKQCQYPHSHVLIDFGKRFQSINSRIFDYDKIHPHIQKVKTRSHMLNCFSYLAKEDPTCKYLLDKVPKKFNIHKIVEKSTALEAMEHASNASDAYAISRLHKEHHVEDLRDSWDDSGEEILELWPWQEKIVSIINTKPKRRGIVRVIVDPVGDNGKNTLARHLESSDSRHIALIQGLSSSRDIIESIIKKRQNGWTGRTLFINIVRGDNINYSTLEQLSDGVMTRIKYDGGDIKYKPYHVILLTNYTPDINRLSKGRWVIHVIKGCKDKSILMNCTDSIIKRNHYDHLVHMENQKTINNNYNK